MRNLYIYRSHIAKFYFYSLSDIKAAASPLGMRMPNMSVSMTRLMVINLKWNGGMLCAPPVSWPPELCKRNMTSSKLRSKVNYLNKKKKKLEKNPMNIML